MHLLTRISAFGLAAATVVGGSCISASGSAGGLGGDTQSSLGLFLENLTWGRLVDVRDSNGVLIEADVLVNHLIESDGVNYEVSNNPVSQKETLTILRDAGSATFTGLLNAAKSNLQGVVDKAADAAPPFTEIARNATVRLQFSEQIDPSSVDFTTIQMFTGNPPLLSFTGRYIVKNDSALDKGYVYFDTTVSAAEAANEAIPQNSVGFPPSADSVSANLAIRIPTQPDPLIGQPKVLRSLDGKHTPSVQDRTTEPFESTGVSDVLVRAARTGNNLDDFNGFLLDNTAPSLLGVQDATVNSVTSISGSVVEFLYSVNLDVCKPMAPKVGDVFEIGNGLLLVTDVLNSADPNNYSVRAALEATDASIVVGATALPTRYTTTYTPQDALVQVCYLDFQPPILTSSIPGGLILIADNASVSVRFDESISATTMRSMSTFVIASPDVLPVGSINTEFEIETAWYRQVNAAESTGDFIDRQRGYDYRPVITGADAASEFGGRILFGPVEATDGNRRYTLTPSYGWFDPQTAVNGEAYVVALRGGLEGILDLSGNPLDVEGFVAGNGQPGEPGAQSIAITVQHTALADGASYFMFNGSSLDENGDGQSEWAGNSSVLGHSLSGRFPARFSRAADSSSPAMSNRLLGVPVTEPLNPAGAVVMSAYRPQEFGFAYGDATEYNMTVEGFNWSPNAGVVFDETFEDVSLSLSTSKFLPDELLNPLTQQPIWRESGLLISAFDDNILGFTADGSSGIDEVEVFRSSYVANSIERFSNNGTPYMPWPEFTANYVWRDTTISQTYLGGAQNSFGAPNQQYAADNGTIFGWGPEAVPSVSLPLLARFRVYPQNNRLGLNSFSVTQMLPLRNPMVNFRIWSSGGQDGSSNWHQVQPDNSALGGTIPIGGFVPGTGNPTTFVGDDHIYWTQADFVVDTSRIYTHWLDMGSNLLLGQVTDVILEPANENQPVGTSITVEFRGAESVTHVVDPGQNPSPLTNADTPFDDHGDFFPGALGTVSTPSDWTTNMSDLEGRAFRFLQVRVTFKSNADLGLRPELDSLGIVWNNKQP
ncbi:MAG: hypothetical protein QM477_02285 [Planctomycetota bacterium]